MRKALVPVALVLAILQGLVDAAGVGGDHLVAWTTRSKNANSLRVLTEDTNDEEDDGEIDIVLNFDAITQAFGTVEGQGGDANRQTSPTSNSMARLSFFLPDTPELVNCSLVRNEIFHPDLHAKYPELVSSSGPCSDGRLATLNLNTLNTESLGAYFTVPGSMDFVYVDYKNDGHYRAYLKSKVQKRRNDRKFKCAVKKSSDDVNQKRGRNLGTANTPTSTPATNPLCPAAQRVVLDPADSVINVTAGNTGLDRSATSFPCGGIKAGWRVKTFIFSAPSSGMFSFSTCSLSNFDSVMSIRSDSCNGRLLGCNDDAKGSGSCSSMSLQLVAGTTTFIQVGFFGKLSGPPSRWGLSISREPYRMAKFRLGMATTFEYSKWAGNSDSLILNRIGITMSRVNGIYMREVGVFMQLIAQADDLFCTPAKPGACTLIPNKNYDTIYSNAPQFFARRGVTVGLYDIGHIFTISDGGVAGLGVVCTGDKARGITGRPNPQGDDFDVDYVAHEMGHQFGADHTFRNCDNPDPNAAPKFAVEPGSGSTIMSYAGICTYNVQPHSDPYFHAISIQQIRSTLSSAFNAGRCDGVTTLNRPSRPSVASDAQRSCVVPLGNFFQLQANSSRQLANPNVIEYYSWDQSNPGLQSYTNLRLGTFRSWKPTRSRQRFFPNLYYLTFGLHTKNPVLGFERLPRQRSSWTMRFTVRSIYETRAEEPSYDASDLGDISYYDMGLLFDDKIAPIAFSAATKTLLGGAVTAQSNVSIAWSVGGTAKLSTEVIILVAKNTMQALNNVRDFDYETDLTTLNWVVAARVANTGSTSFRVPIIPGSSASSAEVNWMIRLASSEACYAFDFIGRGTVRPAQG